MNTLQEKTQWSYRRLCPLTGLSRSRFHRWKSRLAQGKAALNKPGPKPLLALDTTGLQEAMAQLAHHRHRSSGSGLLYEQVRLSISRRGFATIVSQSRRDWMREQVQQMQHLCWTLPGSVWAMDDTALLGRWLWLNQIRDLASRFVLEPRVGSLIHGEELALRLDGLFHEHGAPLVLKMDNGANLKHSAVQAVCAEYGVIVLPSPPYYPRYNGGLEVGNREMKESMRRMGSDIGWQAAAKLAAYLLNHRSRPCLQGRAACAMFGTGKIKLAEYTLPKRKEAIDWIVQKQIELSAERGAGRASLGAAAAWRLAVQTWLQREGLLVVWRGPIVSPGFPKKWSH